MTNTTLTFVDVMYVEGGKGNSRWMAIDIAFQKKNGGYVKQRFFAPETYRERRKISAYFRNLFDVLGVNYDEVQYHYEWYSLAATFKKLLSDKTGVPLYGKVIMRNDREELGLTLPVLSVKDDLVFSPEELMITSSPIAEKITVKEKGGLKLPTQKELTKQRI